MLCQLSYIGASIPNVVGSIPTVARHIFQACPVWIYTQSNITNIIFTWVHNTNTEKNHQLLLIEFKYINAKLFPWSRGEVWLHYAFMGSFDWIGWRWLHGPQSLTICLMSLEIPGQNTDSLARRIHLVSLWCPTWIPCRTWFLIDFGLTILLPFRTRPYVFYTARNAQVAAGLLQAWFNLRSSSRYQDAFESLAPAYNIKSVAKLSTDLLQVVVHRLAASCELQTWCKLWTADLMQFVNCRLDASCELQACCKLWTAGLIQVVNCRLDASCELQAWCKLWTADLMQFVNCRLDASCHPQTWCKLSKGWVRKAPYEASCIHYFEQKNGQTGCHISVVVFRKITRFLHNKLAR
jgi:hypothetical protein